jgi:transposase InsO family protein
MANPLALHDVDDQVGIITLVSRTAHAGFVLDALEQALHDRRPVRGSGLIHHSDRGVQYVSIHYTERPCTGWHRTLRR